MTSTSRAARPGILLRRSTLATGMAGLLALALTACEKGPDRAAVAAQLKADVEAQLQVVESNTAEKVLSHSAVTVTPNDDDRYLVAIDGLKFQPDAEGYLDIGTISYIAKPKDEQDYEVSDLKIAPEIPFKGADGKEKGKLALATKSFSGLWSRELGVFRKFDSEFADISATDDKGADLRLAGLKFTGELADKGGGVFDSTGTATLSGLKAKDSTGDGVFGIGETTVDAKYDSLKVVEYQAAMKKYQELMVKHMAAVETAAKAGGEPPALTADEAGEHVDGPLRATRSTPWPPRSRAAPSRSASSSSTIPRRGRRPSPWRS